jgi:hypothetical protein
VKQKAMKRGEVRGFTCMPELCWGSKGRCWLCGMEWGECQCGCCGDGWCFCGAHAESWRDVRPIHLLTLARRTLRELWECLSYKPWEKDTWWWFTRGWRGL